jgi:hypothetical protein
MSRIVTPMDFALAGLRVWRVQARTAALATMDMTEIAHEMMAPKPNTPRSSGDREALRQDRA